DRSDGPRRPDPRPPAARAVRHPAHRAAGDEDAVGAGRGAPGGAAQRRHLHGHVGGDRAADGRRHPADRRGAVHPRLGEGGAAENPALNRMAVWAVRPYGPYTAIRPYGDTAIRLYGGFLE